MKCPKCQVDNTDTARFCSNCATPLKSLQKQAFEPTKTFRAFVQEQSKGTLIAGGKYRILEEVGRGGMGIVYKAEDLTLNRRVAIKFLPDMFTGDPERLAWFEREAKVLASLNHPNIAAIHGLDETDERRFIVLELVEGETLAERLSRGPMSSEETLDICRQIAEGLEGAHEKGIIHRDLKPANIKITPEGKVKILDFGLAKAFRNEAAGIDLSQSPTITDQMTHPGVIMGTAAYMSPEQAKGKPADKRADIWAFGCILYECLTGKRAFEGETATEIVAAILKGEPNWEALPAAAPWRIKDLLHRCLRKDPKERWRDISDALIEIEAPVGHEPVTTIRAPHLWRSLFWAMTVLSLASIAATIYFGRRGKVEQSAVELTLLAPVNTTFDSIAVSPDGRNLAFTANDTSGKTQLWVRPLSSAAAQPLNGTEGTINPFWSPDGSFIGFFADGRLKKIEPSGGSLQTLTNFSDSFGGGLGGAWNRDGVILFPPTHADPIYRFSAAGGEAGPVTVLDLSRQEHTHKWPQFLPDGSHFLYYASGGPPRQAGMRLGSLDPKESAQVLPIHTPATYTEGPDGSGYLLYIRDRTLLAHPFDAKRLELSGEPFIVIEPVRSFSVSENGVLACDPSGRSENTQCTWFDRAGKRLDAIGPPASQSCPILSPDEKHLAVGREDERDIWVYELARGIGSRLTFHGGFIPIWSPDSSLEPRWRSDGKELFYYGLDYMLMAVPVKAGDVFESGAPQPLFRAWAPGYLRYDVTADGKRFLINTNIEESSSAVTVLLNWTARLKR